uniref:Uncharacterized protein n=1 Tax=Steinernema glaseri TaxID=37863 RepID=A0A1I8ADG3_9BILA
MEWAISSARRATTSATSYSSPRPDDGSPTATDHIGHEVTITTASHNLFRLFNSPGLVSNPGLRRPVTETPKEGAAGARSPATVVRARASVRALNRNGAALPAWSSPRAQPGRHCVAHPV